MSINQWPVAERPREKLLLHGAKSLSDAELLAIFLRTGVVGRTAVDIARDLLIEFGSLQKILQLSAQVLCQKRGIAKAKYALLQAGLELGHRYFNTDIQVGKKLNNPKLTKQFLLRQMGNYPHEVFACLFLDNHHRLICFEELFQGTLTHASVYPREVVKKALMHNAAKVIFAHNHPSGYAIPSLADKELTLLLQQALALVEIKVIDHIIVGGQQNVSFAEAGLI
jgi:DNA repair protein RadC